MVPQKGHTPFGSRLLGRPIIQAGNVNLSGPSQACRVQEMRAIRKEVRMPVVTTLHTILQDPDAVQREVMKELAAWYPVSGGNPENRQRIPENDFALEREEQHLRLQLALMLDRGPVLNLRLRARCSLEKLPRLGRTCAVVGGAASDGAMSISSGITCGLAMMARGMH